MNTKQMNYCFATMKVKPQSDGLNQRDDIFISY